MRNNLKGEFSVKIKGRFSYNFLFKTPSLPSYSPLNMGGDYFDTIYLVWKNFEESNLANKISVFENFGNPKMLSQGDEKKSIPIIVWIKNFECVYIFLFKNIY